MVSTRRAGLTAILSDMATRLALAAGGAVSRFPFTVLCLAVAAILANAWIAGYGSLPDSAQRHVLESLSVSVLWSVGVSAAFAASGRAGVLRHLVSAALGIVAGLFAWFHEPFEDATSVIQLASLLFLFVMPFLRVSGPVDIWNFVLRAFAAFGLAFVAVLAFVSGMVLLVELFRLLFGIGPGWKTYAHVYATALVLVGPMATLGLFPDAASGPASPRLLGLVRGFLAWVAVPLLIAAMTVLHLYAVRVAVTGDLATRDMLWIVPLLLLDLGFVRFLAIPFAGDGAPMAIRAIPRFWLLGLPVPLLLFVLAVMAQSPRGWTLDLYYATLFCLACGVLGLIQLVPAMRGDARWFLGVPAIFLMASLFGPWGAAAVTSRLPTWAPPPAVTASFSDYNAPMAPALAADGFDLVLPGIAIGRDTGDASLDYAVRFEGGDLLVEGRGRLVRFDLSPVMQAVGSQPGSPARGRLVAAGGEALGYDVQFLRIVDGQPQIGRMTLLLNAADWR